MRNLKYGTSKYGELFVSAVLKVCIIVTGMSLAFTVVDGTVSMSMFDGSFLVALIVFTLMMK